jgi:MraZ protein
VYSFSGWYEHSLDDKGRVSLPASFRDRLVAMQDLRVFATKSMSGPCIEVYPDSEWQVLLQRVSGLPQSRPEVIAFRRLFISAASELALDKAGRILLPPTLRAQCGLDKEVLVAGNIEKMEIWDRTTFLAKAETEDRMAVLTALADLGF